MQEIDSLTFKFESLEDGVFKNSVAQVYPLKNDLLAVQSSQMVLKDIESPQSGMNIPTMQIQSHFDF